MAKKLTEIQTIDEAKGAEYNGVTLTRDEEKNIFNDSRLKDSSDSTKIDISKLRDAAKLLDEVKKAQAKTQWNEATDQVVLDKLKKGKTDDTLASKVVNTAKTADGEHLLDSVIAHLEGLKVTYKPQDTGDKKGGHTLAEWKAIRDGHKVEAEEAKSRVEAIQQEIDDYVKLTSEEQWDYDKAKKYRENVEKVINKVKNDTLGKQLLTSIVDRNKAYLVYPNGLYDYGNIVETNVGYDGRNYLTAGQLMNIALQTWEQITLMDETKLFALINGNTYFTSNGRSRTDAKDAYNRLKGRKWSYLSAPKPNEFVRRSVMWTDKDLADGKEYGKENQLVFNDPNSYVNKPLDQRKPEEIQWPFAKPELRDIAIFMKNVFPRNELDTNPIINSTDDELRGKEVVEVSWFGLRNIPKADVFISSTTLNKFLDSGEMSASKKMAQIGKASGFFKIFWDAFKDNSLLDDKTGSMMNVLKFDSNTSATTLTTTSKIRTKLEIDKKVDDNLFSDNWEEALAYADRIKWVVENAKDVNGNDLNIEFDDEWRKVAIQVADTSDTSISALREEKAKNMGWKDSPNKNTEAFVFPYDKKTYDLTLYDKFLSKAITNEKKKRN